MAHDESNRTDRRTFLQTGPCHGHGPGPGSRPECPGCYPKGGVAHAAPGQDGYRHHDSRPGDRQGARCRPAPAGPRSREGVGPSTRRRPITPKPPSKDGSSRNPLSASKSSSSPRTRQDPAQLLGMLDKRLAALGTDYVDLFFIHSFGDYHSLDDAIGHRQEQGAQGGVGGRQEVGQGQTGGHLDPPQGPCPV